MQTCDNAVSWSLRTWTTRLLRPAKADRRRRRPHGRQPARHVIRQRGVDASRRRFATPRLAGGYHLARSAARPVGPLGSLRLGLARLVLPWPRRGLGLARPPPWWCGWPPHRRADHPALHCCEVWVEWRGRLFRRRSLLDGDLFGLGLGRRTCREETFIDSRPATVRWNPASCLTSRGMTVA